MLITTNNLFAGGNKKSMVLTILRHLKNLLRTFITEI